MHHPILFTAGLIRQHVSEVCFGITAVILILAGPAINGFVQRLTQRFHWLVRYLVFVLMCTAGYGFLTQVIYRGLMRWFSCQRSLALILSVTFIYMLLAFFARKQGRI
jgi:hypothetical protein